MNFRNPETGGNFLSSPILTRTGKRAPAYATNAYTERIQVQRQHFLDKVVSLDHFTPVEWTPRDPLNKSLSGPQGRSGRAEKEKIPCPCRDSNPRSSGLYSSAELNY